MIPVNEAIEKIRANAKTLVPGRVLLKDAGGLVLAENVFALCSVPNFNQSAMDGYAFKYEDFLLSRELPVAMEVAAGERPILPAPAHSCVRIFTGAAVPKECDTIVMQEKVELENGKITVLDEGITKGSNIRIKGSEIRQGDLALAKGSFLSPAAIGFLAGIGTIDVLAYCKPSVHIIVTGNELIRSGNELAEGQVYESNSLLLLAALKQLHMDRVAVDFVGDRLDETTAAIYKALEVSDLVLLTGGVSVGDYDFVVKAAEACGIEQLFHRVKQRPGKPLFAGVKDSKMVFGLPGNPASVLSCFYNYVVVAIEAMTGRKNLIEKRRFPLAESFNKKIKLTQFLKAIHNNETVSPLPAQESFRLSSFSIANCLIILPEEKFEFMAGEIVEVLVLPYL